MTTKRLTRSSTNKVLCGVCGGLGQYLAIDPVILRIAWVVAILLPGPNLILILAYFILCLVMPLDTQVPGAPS